MNHGRGFCESLIGGQQKKEQEQWSSLQLIPGLYSINCPGGFQEFFETGRKKASRIFYFVYMGYMSVGFVRWIYASYKRWIYGLDLCVI